MTCFNALMRFMLCFPMIAMAGTEILFDRTLFSESEKSYILVSSNKNLIELKEDSDVYVCLVYSTSSRSDEHLPDCELYAIPEFLSLEKHVHKYDPEPLNTIASQSPGSWFSFRPKKRYYVIGYQHSSMQNETIELRFIDMFGPAIETKVKNLPSRLP